MAHPSITIEAPLGLGHRGAIEWCVEHLIRALDRLDQAEDAAREFVTDPAPAYDAYHLPDRDRADVPAGWDDPSDELTTLSTSTCPALLIIVLGG